MSYGNHQRDPPSILRYPNLRHYTDNSGSWHTGRRQSAGRAAPLSTTPKLICSGSQPLCLCSWRELQQGSGGATAQPAAMC